MRSMGLYMCSRCGLLGVICDWWMVRVVTSFVSELCGALRWVKILCVDLSP